MEMVSLDEIREFENELKSCAVDFVSARVRFNDHIFSHYSAYADFEETSYVEDDDMISEESHYYFEFLKDVYEKSFGKKENETEGYGEKKRTVKLSTGKIVEYERHSHLVQFSRNTSLEEPFKWETIKVFPPSQLRRALSYVRELPFCYTRVVSDHAEEQDID